MGASPYRERAEAQDICVRRWMRATALPPERWAQDGYAEAFARAWDSDRLRGHEELYATVLATSARVRRILT